MSFAGRVLRKLSGRVALRGRVHKVSVVRGGEVSVVVRFGIDEPAARALNQGALLELEVVAEAPPPPPKKPRAPKSSPPAGSLIEKPPGEA